MFRHHTTFLLATAYAVPLASSLSGCTNRTFIVSCFGADGERSGNENNGGVLTTSAADAPAIAQDEPTLLDLRNLVVEFQTRAGRLRAVNDVSLTLGAGRVLAVLGESGSGKSILLRTILGIQPPTARVSGQVLMRGTDLLTLPEKRRAEARGAGSR